MNDPTQPTPPRSTPTPATFEQLFAQSEQRPEYWKELYALEKERAADLQVQLAAAKAERDEANDKMNELVRNGLERQDALEAALGSQLEELAALRAQLKGAEEAKGQHVTAGSGALWLHALEAAAAAPSVAPVKGGELRDRLLRAKRYILDMGDDKTMAPEIESIDVALELLRHAAPPTSTLTTQPQSLGNSHDSSLPASDAGAVKPTPYMQAVLCLAHFELQYHSLRSKARSLLDTVRPLSGHQSAVLTETVEALKLTAAESPPKWSDIERDSAALPSAPTALARDGERRDLNSTRDGVGHETHYRPQSVWSDSDFDMWHDIGLPTKSKRNAAARMAMFREVNPSTKTRYLRVSSTIEVCDLDAPLSSTRCPSCCGTGRIGSSDSRPDETEPCEQCGGKGAMSAATPSASGTEGER